MGKILAMTRRKPEASPLHGSHLRRSIAAAAARLMADDGIADYGLAKRKAARQLGAPESEALPGNDEVEAELRAYQALFQDDEQRERLRDLRAIAIEVMELLAEFRPCLTGAVLDGTAGRFSPIEIDLFADSSKDVEIFLLSQDIAYRVDELPRRGHDAPETRLVLERDDAEVHVFVYPLVAERHVPKHAHGPRARARIAAVAELLAEPS